MNEYLITINIPGEYRQWTEESEKLMTIYRRLIRQYPGGGFIIETNIPDIATALEIDSFVNN